MGHGEEHPEPEREPPGNEAWLTSDQVLPVSWRPWYLERLKSPNGIAWVWPVIQTACIVPDPAKLTPPPLELDREQVAMLRRYLSVVERLLDTSVMNQGASVKVSLFTGEVRTTAPADDATIGFMALLRQLFTGSEEASFDRVRNVIARQAHAAGASETVEALSIWKAAHRTLRAKHLRKLMHAIAAEAGLLNGEHDDGGRRIGELDELEPQELIAAYLNGDMMHWGDGHEQLEQWAATEQGKAMMEIHMRQDAYVLAHFYAGFAQIVETALSSAGDTVASTTADDGSGEGGIRQRHGRRQ